MNIFFWINAVEAKGDNLARGPMEFCRHLGSGCTRANDDDVLNIWRPNDTELEEFFWDVQVGIRSTILDDAKEDRSKFHHLLKDADVFFANKRPVGAGHCSLRLRPESRIDLHGGRHPSRKDHAVRHLVDVDAHRNALGKADPGEDRIDRG